MALTKPTVDSATWGNANTTSPDMVVPGAGLLNTGFLAPPTLPKRGHMNWLMNKVHQGIRYLMAQGISAWDASETNYAVGSVVMVGNLGYVLNTGSATTGLSPSSDLTHWGLLVPIQPGTRLVRRIFSVGSGSSAPSTAGAKRAVIRIIGAGGGGGGALGDSNPTFVIGGGGASGSYGEIETVTIPTNWTFSFGAGGAGGTAPGAGPNVSNGSNGGTSTFSDGTSTWTVPGGLGSVGYDGGLPGAVPTVSGPGGYVLKVAGHPGFSGDRTIPPNTPAIAGGMGGSSFPLGSPGPQYSGVSGVLPSGAGRAGSGFGAGGSGASSATVGFAGAAGLDSWCELIELG